MNKTAGIVAFVAGVAVGSEITWYFLKDKYEKLAQEEIDSVKEVFSNRYSEKNENTELSNKIDTEQTVKEKDEDDKPDYVDYSTANDILTKKYKTEDAEPEDLEGKPYVIPPSDFGMEDDYGEISLMYYADHILADENGDMVEDVENTVGFESLSHFGEYEDDAVCVRNDRLKCDYEILIDNDRYEDHLR